MRNKLISTIVNIFTFIRKHLLIEIIAVSIGSVLFILCYGAFRYPDDKGFLEATPGLVKDSVVVKNELLLDNITEISSLVVIPAYTKDTSDKIAALQFSGYLKTNPYTNSPYVFRYATGHTGLWLDEKNSLLLPCGSIAGFPVTPQNGSRIEFYVAALSFEEKNGKRKLEVSVTSGGKNQIIKSQYVDLYNRQEFNQTQTPPSKNFSKIYPSTGWLKVSADISQFKGKQIKVEIISQEKEGFLLIGNPVHYASAALKKYNVIHIVFDAMNCDYMGIYNPSSTLTPNFMAQKNDFIIFDKFYSLATNTRIYLSGMFTSQFPPATRHGYNDHIIFDEEKNIFYNDKSMDTLPQAMKRNGYLTLQTGNSGFTNPALQTSVDYGFSESFDFQGMPYDSTGIAYHLIRTLKDRKNAPIYLYAHFNTTHKPRITPIKYYFKGFLKNPDKIWRPNVTGSTMHADALFSQIVNALKKEGLWESTIFIVTSDHGTLYHLSNFGRNYLLDDFIHTPFMIHLPEELKKRYADGVNRFTMATSVINLAPTILDITGSTASTRFRGKSILPYLGMKNPPEYTDEYIRSFDNYGASIIYKGRWKYVQFQHDQSIDREFRSRSFYFFGSGPSDSNEVLYDLEDDPLEKRNIIGLHKDIAALCRKAFLNGSTQPALNMITIFPDGKNHKVNVSGSFKEPPLRTGIIAKTGNDSFKINKNRFNFTVMLSDKPRYLYFEGADTTSSFTVKVFCDGKTVDNSNFLCGSYNLPLVSQNSPVEGTPLLSALLITEKPSAPVDKSGVTINLSRMDIRRWAQDQSSGADGGMDANMKEVMKSWGYIQ